MRALIVDDVPSMRHFLAMALAEFRDLSVDHAGDGLQALKMATQSFYDLILLDLNLPLMDGFRMLSTLRGQQREKQSVVIIISTSSPDEVQRRAGELQATYLPKPVKAFQVRDLVRELLGYSQVPEPEAAERRQLPRLGVRVRAEFGGTAPREMLTENINALGAFLLADEVEPVGAVGSVKLHFPHLPEPIEVNCRVLHVRPVGAGRKGRGFGVRFEPANAEISSRLAEAFVSPSDK